jgi:hypothetical protein
MSQELGFYFGLSPDGLAVVDQKRLRGSFAAIFAGCLTCRSSNHLVDKIGTKFFPTSGISTHWWIE